MQNRTLGVAIHGAGVVARAHGASWKKNGNVRIVSVTSRRGETAQRFADELTLDCRTGDDFDAVLRDPAVDIVDICSPNHVHAAQAIAAARAGKHLLVEKPIALTMADNRALRDEVARAGVRTVVSFVLRWHPQVVLLKNLLAARTIGELIYAETDYWHGISPLHHAWDLHSRIATGGSAMLLVGCHAIDVLRYVLADEIVEVAAQSNNKKGLYEYHANVVATLRFRGGTVAKTSVLLDCSLPYTFNIDLVGTEGALRDNRLWSPQLFPGQKTWTPIPVELIDSADVHHHPFDAEVNDLVDAIQQQKDSRCTVADAFLTHELCLAIDRSIAEGGRPVRLPLD
jgi:predicted dehydrogenase